MFKQEYMIEKIGTKSRWFFLAHSHISAYDHAKKFLERNGKEGYQLYRKNDSGIGERWLEVK